MEKGFYHTKESVDQYIELAKDVNSEQLIHKLKPFLTTYSKILEIGSGPGTDFELLKNDYTVVGSDFSDEFLHRLKSKFPNDEFLKLDARTLATSQRFDGIYANKVFQHLTDSELKDSILRQCELLNSGGVICHSFWNGEGVEEHMGMMVNYQNQASLKSLFGNYFQLLLLEEYCEFEENDSIVLIGKKL